MHLKVWTTVFLLAGTSLLIAWPWLVGPKPGDGASKKELADYGLRMLTYFGITVATFLIAAVLAWLLIRKMIAEYLVKKAAILDDLVEVTLEDHARRQQ
jgi:hypothetical protein